MGVSLFVLGWRLVAVAVVKVAADFVVQLAVGVPDAASGAESKAAGGAVAAEPDASEGADSAGAVTASAFFEGRDRTHREITQCDEQCGGDEQV
jgi:hypothetical protein